MTEEELLKFISQNPTVFKIVQYQGKKIIKIISDKFKEIYSSQKEEIKKFFNKSSLLNETELNYFLSLSELNQNDKYQILRKFMKPKDWACFLLSQRALVERKSLNYDEELKIREDVLKGHGSKGGKIFRFTLQGYFDEIIIPLLEYQTKSLGSDSEVNKWFDNFFEKIIEFFPKAFWVANLSTKQEIRREIIKRCIASEFKDINIHTIGKYNQQRIEEVIKEFSQDRDFPKFNWTVSPDAEEIEAMTYNIKIL